jgi:hypothetical protein
LHVFADTPCTKQQKRADNVVVKKCRRVFSPGVPAANRLAERRQNAEHDREVSTNRDEHLIDFTQA